MNIAIFEADKIEQNYFNSVFPDHNLTFVEDDLSIENVEKVKNAEILVVFVYSKVTKEIIDLLPNLKFITTMSTGFDHIDLEAAKAKNIVVSNVPIYAETVVAEHTFALLLAISRRLEESTERARKGNFDPEGLTGFELRGKTLGVIGIGAIGKHVIEIANGFGMNILAYTRHPDLVLEQKLKFKHVDLDILLKSSDIISLHIPYTKETHHFLSKEQFDKMKNNVVIINTARGGLIHNSALLAALESGKVYAAGLDVLEEEPVLHEEKQLLSSKFDREKLQSVLEDHMLCNHPKVVITPHNGFNSYEALNKILETTHDNIESFAVGTPINIVS